MTDVEGFTAAEIVLAHRAAAKFFGWREDYNREDADQVAENLFAFDEGLRLVRFLREEGWSSASEKSSANGETLYKVGDPDPTSATRQSGIYCRAPFKNTFICTWEPGHEHPQHVAGNGAKVVAVWDKE